MEEHKHFKSLLVQNLPIYNQKTQNIKRMQVSLEKYSPKDGFDVVVFPEMSFTGYNFKDQKDASKLACYQGEGE